MKTEKQIEEEDERYLEVKLEAVKWMKDTDMWKLGTVNILTLFALHIEKQKKAIGLVSGKIPKTAKEQVIEQKQKWAKVENCALECNYSDFVRGGKCDKNGCYMRYCR